VLKKVLNVKSKLPAPSQTFEVNNSQKILRIAMLTLLTLITFNTLEIDASNPFLSSSL
jgi:hypothetical protein